MFLYEEDHIRLVPGDPDKIKPDLDNGLYVMKAVATPEGPLVTLRRKADYAEGIVVKGGPFTKLRNDVDSFLSKEQAEAREELGMSNKVGYLMKGDPGTGKTFLACQIGEELAQKYNAIALVTNTIDAVSPTYIIDEIRSTLKDPNKLIIYIMDEFEKSRAKFSSEMLAFLDGASSRENVIVMATVNDADELPKAYTNRPGRFEQTYDFSITDKAVLTSIIKQTLPEKYHKIFKIEDLVKKLVSGTPKFGLSGGDNVTIDKVRIMLRNMIADYKKEGTVIEPKIDMKKKPIVEKQNSDKELMEEAIIKEITEVTKELGEILELDEVCSN